jgi:radical SAM superfamily enzyme YgiQ (UPF0313 family)
MYGLNAPTAPGWTWKLPCAEQGIPLIFAGEQAPPDQFDIIALTLPYETLYTNTLNLLDLAEIPVRSTDRTEAHPLVIAGGHAAFNPEPMSAFIDAFIIGEGEEVIHEVVDAYQDWKPAALTGTIAPVSGSHPRSLYSRILCTPVLPRWNPGFHGKTGRMCGYANHQANCR